MPHGRDDSQDDKNLTVIPLSGNIKSVALFRRKSTEYQERNRVHEQRETEKLLQANRSKSQLLSVLISIRSVWFCISFVCD